MAAKTKPQAKNFLEALEQLGKSAVSDAKVEIKKIVTQDLPESFGISQSQAGTLKPNESVSLDQLKAAEARGESRAAAEYERRLFEVQNQERQRYQQLEAQAKQQISVVQQEIRSLAGSIKQFSHEVDLATSRAVVNPGAYHRNFFDHLRQFILTLRTKVEHSRNWLATSNSRAKKQGFYWGQVKKSGTKYMLSSERYMVTSTG